MELTALVFLPAAAAVLILLLPQRYAKISKWIALAAAIAALVLSVVLFFSFEHGAGYQFVERYSWIQIAGFDIQYALGVDVLAPEGYGEIVGGGQREDDHDLLVKRIKEHKLPVDGFKWYLDLRKYGSVPHSGFGLGLERTVSWICGIDHIRQTIPFPRTMGRLEP